MGVRLPDIPSKMSWSELSDFVTAAPPTSAIYISQHGGWSKTDQLIATLIEVLTGHAVMSGRFERPGVTHQEASMDRQPHAPKKNGGKNFGHAPDVLTLSEFQAKYAAQQEKWAQEAAAAAAKKAG